MSVHGVL